MSNAQTALQKLLKSQKLSLTTGRRQLYEVLSKNEPLTMAELVTACPALDRATVYRSVALFERLGIVQRLQIGWKYRLELSNEFQDHHHHLTCLSCGRMIALPEDDTLEKRLLTLAQGLDFKAQDHQLEIRGYCKSCQLSVA